MSTDVIMPARLWCACMHMSPASTAAAVGGMPPGSFRPAAERGGLVAARPVPRPRSLPWLSLTRICGTDSLLGRLGAVAQMGERRHGMAEVVGSIPTGSTRIFEDCGCSSEVERDLAKVDVGSSILLARSKWRRLPAASPAVPDDSRRGGTRRQSAGPRRGRPSRGVRRLGDRPPAGG